MTTSPRPHALRRIFRAGTAAAVVATAPFSMGATTAAQDAAGGRGTVSTFHRDQGLCPLPGASGGSTAAPFNFAANPREQQRLLESIGLVIGREEPDGVFRERTLQSLNEWRILYYGFERNGDVPFAQSLTASELADLRAFSERVQRERRTHGLTLEAATALRFASRATDAVHANLVRETNKGRSGFTGSTAGFLYLVKTQGHKYGLGWFAGQIAMSTAADGTATTRVDDPVTFLMLEDLRRHPRIALMMEAEQIRLGEAMPATDYARGTPPAGIPLNRLQADLLTLGFSLGGVDGDFGPKTEAAYHIYRSLYAPLVPDGQDVDGYLGHFADLAQRDARTYGISTAAAAAIRLGALRTGVDFGYMMELSSAESNFDHTITASTSSATGLYQFTEDTWLQTINRYGDWYGMQPLAAQMENTYDMNGLLVGRVENPFIRVSAFDLRSQPHIAALMGAEFQQRNRFRIECELGRRLNRTEMYFGHFLGPDGAITFLQNRDRNPGGSAASAFPVQAAANVNVFYSRDRRGRRTPRSYNEVYAFFDRKFDRAVFEDNGNVATLGIQLRSPQEAHAAASPAAAAPVATAENRGRRFSLGFARHMPWDRGQG
jgi:hypothetical protein